MSDTQRIVKLDMASAMEAIRTFSGTENEDITTWIKEVQLVQNLLSLEDDTTLKAAALRLRGKAQQWCCNVFKTSPCLKFQEFIKLISSQYCNPQRVHNLLEKFLSTKIATTKEEFRELLNNATILLEKGCLNSNAMIKLLISRAPPELKIVLLQASMQAKDDWHNFIKMSEDHIWVAFPEHHLHTISTNALKGEVPRNTSYYKKGTYNSKPKTYYKEHEKYKNNFNGMKTCSYHGQCYHSTHDCMKIKDLEARGINYQRYKSTKGRINEITLQKEEKSNEDSDLNKENINYSHNTNLSLKKNIYIPCYKNINISKKILISNVNAREEVLNIFKTTVFTKNGVTEALIDTGAEYSIVPIKHVPKCQRLYKIPTNLKIVSASGDDLKILGMVKNFEIRLLNQNYVTEAYIVEKVPQYIILGLNFIYKYPLTISKLVGTLQANKKKLILRVL